MKTQHDVLTAIADRCAGIAAGSPCTHLAAGIRQMALAGLGAPSGGALERIIARCKPDRPLQGMADDVTAIAAEALSTDVTVAPDHPLVLAAERARVYFAERVIVGSEAREIYDDLNTVLLPILRNPPTAAELADALRAVDPTNPLLARVPK